MTSKLEKLTQDLIECDKLARAESDQVTDAGACNLDAVFLRLPRMQESKVLAAINAAGMCCNGKRKWLGNGYFLHANHGGQANKRDKYVMVMRKEMLERGYDVVDFRMMD